MNDALYRPGFDSLDAADRQALMEGLASRYGMRLLGLRTFDRWNRSCTTGLFEGDGREFVFVPGDTVTLGWDGFAVGPGRDSLEELEELCREWGTDCDPEGMVRMSMTPVRRVTVGPMLVGRKPEGLCWERVGLDDPRLRPEWLIAFREFAWSDCASLELGGRARIERTPDGFPVWIHSDMSYGELLEMLDERGLSIPTADEWAYLCGGGCRTLFPWGDGIDPSMRLRWFGDAGDGPSDPEEPNFFGLSIAYDPYMREVVKAERLTTCGGDGGCGICGGLGPFLGYLPCSPHCRPEVREDEWLDGDYDFYRPVIRIGDD